MNIRLEKWYFDTVTSQGKAWIGYSAQLRILGIPISYAQSLRVESNRNPELQTSFSKHQSPLLNSSSLFCDTSLFKIEVEAKGNGGFSERLFGNDTHFVDWHCLLPSANTRINFPNSPNLSGRGYVEKLIMTIPPWKLPLNTLIWGRFIGDKHSVVWIHWGHAQAQSWLFVDGKKQQEARISSTHVGSETMELAIENERTLIAAKPFREHTRILGYLLPASMRTMHEEKWLGRGSLIIGDEQEQGSVIHEYVRFNHDKT